jgi:hypothetical protein
MSKYEITYGRSVQNLINKYIDGSETSKEKERLILLWKLQCEHSTCCLFLNDKDFLNYCIKHIYLEKELNKDENIQSELAYIIIYSGIRDLSINTLDYILPLIDKKHFIVVIETEILIKGDCKNIPKEVKNIFSESELSSMFSLKKHA